MENQISKGRSTMMDFKIRILTLFFWLPFLLSVVADDNAEKRVVCYYTNWSVYRPGTAKFSPQNINPYLCTHLIYAFGGFTKDNTLKPFDKYQDIEKGGYAKFTGLKTYNKNLKTMLAIGGWNEGSSRFSPMVADPGRRKDFVKNSIKFLRQNHFDGLDLDWEYPAFRDGGKPRDRNNYADLVQELREGFDRESSKTGRPRLLLSMAVPAGIEYIDKGYDIPRLNDYLDFINLLSYDYHSAYEPATNHHSPLYPLEEDNEYNYDSELTIDYTIEHLLKSGASPEKIVLGIPTYGRSYTLFNEDATDIGAPADGPGEEGDATREKGYLAYYEICESIAKSDEWEVVQPNPNAMGPYAFRGNQWVGYDDEDIVRAKASYVNEKKLGGIMFWSIDNDDFRGKCHGRPYPLIEAAKEALFAEDEKSHSGRKTKLSDNHKKTKSQGSRIQGNAISRKSNAGRRSSTTESSSSKRRIGTSRSNGRSNGRQYGQGSEDDEDNDDSGEEEVNSLKSVDKPRSRTRGKNTRSRNRSTGAGRKKQKNSQRNDDDSKIDSSKEESRNNKFTTPEPPTTPDPGTDFKCEDEGFFSHPRDCKKYFWCLDSGPGGLGIVGHQFTCPSGLVFNKAADSCDYPRNVVCPKTKPSQTTVTTTRAPITAATSRTTYLHKPTQRTTTPKSESEEEYEYYDDEDEDAENSQEIEEEIPSTTTAKTYKTINRSRPTTTTSVPSTTTTTTTEASIASSTKSYKTNDDKATSFEDEEDPRVIKELIDLIKKAGGIEQLEKQLHYQEKNSGSNIGTTEENGRSTPATISRSLYERVLNRQATRIAGGFLGSLSTTQSSKGDKTAGNVAKNSRTGFVNGPGGAQFEGLDKVPEVKNLRRTNKHQYVTIERQRQSTSESSIQNDEGLDEEEDEDSTNVASSEDRSVSKPLHQKNSNRRIAPSYVNIRRPRPSTTTRSENDVDLKDEDEDTAGDSEENAEEEEEDDNEEEAPVIQRHRIVKAEEESPSPKSRYTNIQRFRSTTTRSSVDKVASSSVKDHSTTSTAPSSTTTTTTTTTEKVVPVTEEILDIPTTLPTTEPPSSTSSESLINVEVDNKTSISESTLEETSSIINDGTTRTSVNDTPLKLVENSATEILLTTVPASSITFGSNSESFTQGPTVAAVSQPRPFGFSRRGRPTTTSSTAATPSATASVTEQTRSKVSSRPTRNFARSSNTSRQRGRPRSRLASSSISTTENLIKENDNNKYLVARRRTDYDVKRYDDQDDDSDNDDNDEETAVSKSRSSSIRRGFSRFTPPSFNAGDKENSGNYRQNKRNRPTTLSADKITTESSFIEENSVLPISRSRGRPTIVSTTTGDNITTESRRNRLRPIYGKSTTATSARTNNEIEDSPIIRILQKDNSRSNSSRRWNDDRNDEDNYDDRNDEKITNIRVFDRFDKESNESATFEQPDATRTLTFFHTTESSVLFNDTESLNQRDNFSNIDAESISPANVDDSTVQSTTLNFEETNMDTFSSSSTPGIIEASKPVKKRILKSRRPVAASTTSTTTSSSEEVFEDKPNSRKRKIIRRLRPSVQNSTPEVENIDEQRKHRSRLFSRIAAPKNDTDLLQATTTEEDTKISTTPRSFTIIVESPRINETSEESLYDDNAEAFFSSLETSTATDISVTGNEFDPGDPATLLPTTIVDTPTIEPEMTKFPEETTEKSDYPEEETYSTDEIISTTPSLETLLPDESTTTNDESVTFSDIFSTEIPTTLELRATTASPTTTTSESRFVRKKFVRKRPSTSLSNGRRFGSSKNLNRASVPVQNTDTGVLSNRRKNLFVRRRPVSSTTSKTTSTIAVKDEDTEYPKVYEDFGKNENENGEQTTRMNDPSEVSVDTIGDIGIDDFWKSYTTPATETSATIAVTLPNDLEESFTSPVLLGNKYFSDSVEEELGINYEDKILNNNENEQRSEDHVEINYRRPDQRPVFRVPQSLSKKSSVETTTQLSRSTHKVFDSSPEESAETKLSDENPRTADYRKPRTRFGTIDNTRLDDEQNRFNDEDFTEKFRSANGYKERINTENTALPLSFWSTQNAKNRVYPKRLSTTTEQTITETLVPAKKFDYVADAQLRKQQSLRTTQRYEETTKMSAESKNDSGFENEVFGETDLTTRSSSDKPQITRLVTSVVESGTTERQIIHIKTKYSSLTSTTRIPVQTTHSLRENSNSAKSKNLPRESSDEFYNEIRESTERSSPERSTLPIESEFSIKNRITTDRTAESSTIEIESVFSNLIARDLRT